MKTARYKVPSPLPEQLLTINNFQGINLATAETQIADNESPDMLNFKLNNAGRLVKRTGYDKCFSSLGAGNINGMTEYKGLFLFAFKDKLYKLNQDNTTTIVYTGLNDHKVKFFEYGGKLYILDGLHYISYDGTTVSEIVPYSPLIFIACDPATGSGTENEQWNLIGNSFKQRYNTDGTVKDFQLSFTNLDATAVKASLDGITFDKVEGTDFTVNRTTGKVSFTTAPPTMTDSLTIQAFKTQTGLPDRIKKCTDFAFFGGINDTRVILYGNPDTPSVIYRSGILDPSYFPENTYQAVGNTGEKVVKLVLQYDSCLVIKERSLWLMTFELTDNGAVYPVRPLNDTVGCNNAETVQLINNSPMYLNNKGIYQVTQSNIRTEKNVELISEKVNKELLNDTITASIDYDHKYILCGQKKTYVMDYLYGVWLIWDNIKAMCFLEYNKMLYFGDNNGTIHRFKLEDERFPYVDNGFAIKSYWKSKPFGMGHEERNKLVQKLFVTLAPYKRTGAYFYYVTDMVSIPRNQDNLPNYSNMMYSKSFYNDRIFDAKSEFIDGVRVELLDYSDLDYSLFSYSAEEYPSEFVMKVKAKKIVYYQFVVQNNKVNENVGIDGFVLKYYVQNYRK